MNKTDRIATNVSWTTKKPERNRDHVALSAVTSLYVEHDGKKYYPEFQTDPDTNTLWYNVATCIAIFRDKDPSVSTLALLFWFNTPNEYLDWKTPLEVGAHPDKETRTKIIEVAENDTPLNNKTGSTW